MTTEIIEVKAQEFGIEEKTAQELVKGLDVVKQERELLIQEFDVVSKLEITQETVPQFRKLRLAIQKNRTQGVDKWHKTSKEYFLRGGQFVDAIKNKENQINTSMEEVLMNGEKHFENLEREAKKKLQQQRVLELGKFYPEGTMLPSSLGEMDEDTWKNYLTGARVNYETRIEAERKAKEESERIELIEKLRWKRSDELRPYYSFITKEDEKMKLGEISEEEFSKYKAMLQKSKAKYDKEQEEIRLENERLKKEAQVKEAQLEKERQKLAKEKAEAEAERKRLADIQAKKDAEAKAERDRLQAELDAKNKTEAEATKKRNQEILAEKQKKDELAKAPIQKQLIEWVNLFELPHTMVNNTVTQDIEKKFESFKVWAKSEISKM